MKLKLTIGAGTLAGQEFALETGFMTIGRSETCSVRLDPLTERIASKQHAFIETKPDGFYITDNSSTNGTLVNGEQVSTRKLSTGDNVQFGRNGVTASIVIEGGEASVAPDSFREAQVQEFEQVISAAPVSVQLSVANLGLGSVSVAKPEEKSKTGTYIGIGLTIFAIIFLAMIVALIMFASVGVIPAVIATVIAFVPAMLYLLPLMWLDRYDPEPFWLMALAFAWGGLVAVVISFVINTAISIIVGVGVSPEIGEAVGAVISAPVFEEGSKGLGLLVLLIFFRKYFDDILDGIIFAGVIALGFATVENVLYYGRALAGAGFGGVAFLFVLRGIMSPFAHVTFTAMTGIGCGIARESHKGIVRLAAPLVGYFFAVLLHAIWNGMAVIGGLEGFILGYLVLEVPFFLIFVGFAFYVMYRQNRILKEMLAIDVARGLISQEMMDKATSAFKSTPWLIGGLFNGKFRARSRYLRAVGKLGLSYWHIQRATAAQGQTASFQQNPLLREEVLEWRDKV
ncbi:MAG: PrsW family intramembrane metalloprotease [Acidobacteria bacterium]|nr:PrsW family intramembrane metalloprotease [Acidobacteriota bacterium]MCW5949068.1 PrsW family intramembrane metalloprotease [Pyrinomonadaceae bacterium]